MIWKWRKGFFIKDFNKKVIGLTGISGSGKSTVSKILSELDFYVIDADKIGHDIILPGNPTYFEIINKFGHEILISDNGNLFINRKKLGKIVFSDPDKLSILNNIVHGKIISYIENLLNKLLGDKIYNKIVIDAALLIQTGLHKLVDEVWVVSADDKILLERIVKRDNISFEDAARRIKNQMSYDEMCAFAYHVIKNNGSIEQLKKQVLSLLA